MGRLTQLPAKQNPVPYGDPGGRNCDWRCESTLDVRTPEEEKFLFNIFIFALIFEK
jgi:hypothetical protein